MHVPRRTLSYILHFTASFVKSIDFSPGIIRPVVSGANVFCYVLLFRPKF